MGIMVMDCKGYSTEVTKIRVFTPRPTAFNEVAAGVSKHEIFALGTRLAFFF